MGPIDAEQAVEHAREFLIHRGGTGEPFTRLRSCTFDEENRKWRVVFDVGAVVFDFRAVTLDDATGRVLLVEDSVQEHRVEKPRDR